MPRRAQSSVHDIPYAMSYLKFKWVKQGEQYVFNGQAETARSQQEAVEAELLEIWRWIGKQRLAPHRFVFDATRQTVTAKHEVLTVSHGAVQADGQTVFHPQVTKVALTLPESAAVQFRFSFDVVDDRD